MGWASWFGGASVSDAEVRAEIWRLGGRHMGEPLAGALQELRGQDVSAARTLLLQACVRKMQAG